MQEEQTVVELLFVIIQLKTPNFIVSLCECDEINTYIWSNNKYEINKYFMFGPISYHKEYM